MNNIQTDLNCETEKKDIRPSDTTQNQHKNLTITANSTSCVPLSNSCNNSDDESSYESNLIIAFFKPNPNAISKSKLVVNKFSKLLGINCQLLCNIICNQENVGCLLYVDDDDNTAQTDDKLLCGVSSILNIQQYNELHNVLSKKLKQFPNSAELTVYLNTPHVGLLISERVASGLPIGTCAQSYIELDKDIQWTHSLTDLSEEEAKELPYYKFDYIMILAKAYVTAQIQPTKSFLRTSRKLFSKDSLMFANSEFAAFYKKATVASMMPSKTAVAADGSKLFGREVCFIVRYKDFLKTSMNLLSKFGGSH